MHSLFTCPGCGKRMRVPDAHLGKTIRCRGCGGAVDTFVAPSDAVELGPEDEAPAEIPPMKLGARILSDPAGRLRGVYPAELSRDGLRLTRKAEEVRIPVGTRVESAGGNRIAVPMEGRVVTLAVSRMGLYPDRLARAVAAFLTRRAGPPVAADCTIPRWLMALAFLPAGILGVGIQGGMIGGAITGAFAGSLIALNLAVVRRERWPLGARAGACLGVDAAGYATLILALVALLRPAGPPAGPEPAGPAEVIAAPPAVEAAWGTPEDPAGDCRIEAGDDSATIEVPGTVHHLGVEPGRDQAPRIMQPADGHFVAEVRVVGEVRPVEPPAPTSDVAFQGAGLLLHGRVDGLIRLERAAFARGGTLRTYILFEHHRPGLPMDAQMGEYPGGPVWLRLERRGTAVDASYSVDRTTWQRLRTFDFGDVHPTVGVAATNTAASPLRAKFEGFRLEKP